MSGRRAVGMAFVLAAVVGGVIGILGVGSGGAEPRSDDVKRVRAATARFHHLPNAERADHGELVDAAGLSCIEDPAGAGGMGTHFVNGSLVGDGKVDVEHPEALLYDRTGNKDRLLGVEYVVLVEQWGRDRPPPHLFDKDFDFIDEPNRYGLPPFYALHAWVWEDNPAGTFEDWNPNIGC